MMLFWVEDKYVLFLAVESFNGTEITSLWENELKEYKSKNPS